MSSDSVETVNHDQVHEDQDVTSILNSTKATFEAIRNFLSCSENVEIGIEKLESNYGPTPDCESIILIHNCYSVLQSAWNICDISKKSALVIFLDQWRFVLQWTIKVNKDDLTRGIFEKTPRVFQPILKQFFFSNYREMHNTPKNSTSLKPRFVKKSRYRMNSLNIEQSTNKMYFDRTGNVNLSNLILRDRFQNFIKPLATNTWIHTLDLSVTHLGSEHAKEVTQLLRMNLTLRSLNLHYTRIDSEGARALLATCSWRGSQRE
mmetsp:Transcript_11770/g.12931  ORF Transcript_11770/g.12931 Transcript_11770/m.12931 type:complete len:263 (-) Transcript_11770:587-1375(-)